MSSPSPVFRKSFPLDAKILAPGSAASVAVSVTGSPDVVLALEGNHPLPPREFSFDAIDLGATLTAGPGTVTVQAGVHTALAVFNSAAGAVQSLQLANPPLTPSISGDAADRFLCAVVGYQASGQFTASQPIGAIGTATFGAQAAASGLLAVIHRFAPDTPSLSVLANTASSLQLPRHISGPGDLEPGTWIVAESDGSLALQLAASLGYDLNFVRKANLLGISRQLSARIDASAKATFGFSVAGRYLVVVGRPDAGTKVRLQIFKQAKDGLTFGLNAEVGIVADPGLPTSIDGFVEAIFGVHGLQVLNDLREWTDPSTDLSQKVARLGLDEAKDLIRATTGKDPDTELAAGHKILTDQLAKWNALPDRAAAALWHIIDKNGATGVPDFKAALAALANLDPVKSAAAIDSVLQSTAFGDSESGRFLTAIAGPTLSLLKTRIPDVQKASALALDILNRGVIGNLQRFIGDKLDLQKVVDLTDPAQLDPWLQKRLADFLDKPLDLPAFKEVQSAIHLVLQQSQTLYAKALQAATNRYSAQLAAAYQRTETGAALADAVFDLADPAAARLFASIMRDASLDPLFTTTTSGVTVNQATLTHEISRQTSVQVHLPYFDSKTQHITDSVASLKIESDAGRVLVYQFNASDKLQRPRFLSQMQVVGSVSSGSVSSDSTVAYQMLLARKQMSADELRYRTGAFLAEYLPAVFPTDAARDTFYAGIRSGAALLNLQVTLPAAALQPWFTPRTNLKPGRQAISAALQLRLRQLIPLFYFQDLDNLVANEPAATLLAWAGFPIVTTDDDVYWNWPDPEMRQAMILRSSLAPLLADAHARLTAAGRKNARDFDADQELNIRRMAQNDRSGRLESLCQVEAELVTGAAGAFTAIQKAVAKGNTDPSVAIEALADAGAKLTSTFNKAVAGIYGGDASRSLNSMLLVEASRALGVAATPEAMLNLSILAPNATFNLAQFPLGELPPKTDVAQAQSLVSA